MSIENILPPDDTGSDTYRRYRYQAEIAFPYVLACALGEGVEAVLLEHVEDIAVLAEGRWTLRQVKTRDLGLGPWKASDVRARGGGLDSLHRAYLATLGLGVECRFELFLEGGIKNGDPISRLADGTAHECDEIVQAVHGGLGGDDGGATVESTREFLRVTRVVAVADTRATIEPRNLRLIAGAAPHLDGNQQDAVYRDFMYLIDRAMAGEGDDLLARAIHAEQTRAGAKTLRRDSLSALTDRLAGTTSVLLRRMVDGGPSMTTLVQKLNLGRAPERVIDDAKDLRAQASAWELEQLGAGNIDDDQLEDVRRRLELLSNAVNAQFSSDEEPAGRVWSAIHERLHAAPAEYDRNSLFVRDPALLLGVLCDLSDQCRTGWGVARA